MNARPAKDPDQSRYRGVVGAAIRARREKLGLTVPDLVERLASEGCQLAEIAVRQYEQGKRPLPIDALPAFAAALETTIHRLLPMP